MSSKNTYNIAVVGATGVVGSELLQLLEKSPLDKITLTCFASEKSAGNKIRFRNQDIMINSLTKDNLKDYDIMFFCAGSDISKKYLPLKNNFVIDLSSAFRNHDNVPLIIPEINGHLIKTNNLIASPNCTTTIMLMALHPLHREFKIKRVVASTYQAASGGGLKLMNKLEQDSRNYLKEKKTCSNSYGFNLFLHDSPLTDSFYTEEEIKMEKETVKILNDPNIKVTATCVRVPVFRAHSIALNIEFHKTITVKKAYELLQQTPNVKIIDDFSNNKFATPFDATGKNEVLVSRIRKDRTQKNTLELWAVGDQILKGAALNAYQIAMYYLKN